MKIKTILIAVLLVFAIAGSGFADSIVGSWGTSDRAITFYQNGTYLIYHNGAEYGNYSYNSSSGILSVSTITDYNGDYGMADNGSPNLDGIKFFVNGNTLTVEENGNVLGPK